MNEFSVYQWFADGSYEVVLKLVSDERAVRVAQQLTESIGAKIGITRQIMITDGGDSCVFEWKFGEGVTFPKPKGK
jgi:hypothetical protein